MVHEEPHDRVDAIREQWRTVRPDLDCSPMEVVGRLSRASRLLERSIRETLAEYGIEPWEFDVLAALLRSGEPHALTAGALSTAMLVSPAALTNRVDRLVDKGLVHRDLDPTHRRRMRISLADRGLHLVNELVEHHLANERQQLAGLSADELDQLAGLLRRLLFSLGDHDGSTKTPGTARRT